MTDEGLAVIKGWKKLKRLNVRGAKFSDTTLDHISGITTLESLNIGSGMVTDIGLERLTTLPNLKELTIGGNKLTDAGLQALRQMPALQYLDLGGRQGTDANIWAIRMSGIGLDAILSLKNLRELRFACTSVGVGLEGARFADVTYVSVTTGWLEKMKALPKLEKLQLEGCDRVSDDSIPALAALRDVVPWAVVTYAVPPAVADICSRCPYVDFVAPVAFPPLDRPWRSAKSKLQGGGVWSYLSRTVGVTSMQRRRRCKYVRLVTGSIPPERIASTVVQAATF